MAIHSKILLTHIVISLTLIGIISCGYDTGEAPQSDKIYRVFVTASKTNADMGGIVGADAICSSDFNNPGDGTFKAFLVDGSNRVACSSSNCGTGGVSENVNWVLHPNAEYVRLDNTMIGRTDSSGIFIFPLTESFSEDETLFWSGFSISQNWIANFTHCENWSSSSSGINSQAGRASDINVFVLRYGFRTCNTTLSLICVEQ